LGSRLHRYRCLDEGDRTRTDRDRNGEGQQNDREDGPRVVRTQRLDDHVGDQNAARDPEDDLNGSPCPLTAHLREHDERRGGREESAKKGWGWPTNRVSKNQATVAATVDSTTSNHRCHRWSTENSQPTHQTHAASSCPSVYDSTGGQTKMGYAFKAMSSLVKLSPA